jgi:hypothetical protein
VSNCVATNTIIARRRRKQIISAASLGSMLWRQNSSFGAVSQGLFDKPCKHHLAKCPRGKHGALFRCTCHAHYHSSNPSYNTYKFIYNCIYNNLICHVALSRVSTKAPLVSSDWKVEKENTKKKRGSGRERKRSSAGERQKEKRASAASSAVIFSAGVVLIR